MNKGVQLSIITFNIHADFLSHKDVPAWAERKALCLRALRLAQPDLSGLQEVMPRQFDFLQEVSRVYPPQRHSNHYG
jgi:hypothetical protein